MRWLEAMTPTWDMRLYFYRLSGSNIVVRGWCLVVVVVEAGSSIEGHGSRFWSRRGRDAHRAGEIIAHGATIRGSKRR